MKLKFKHQQFQTDAVHAVADLFKGQPRRQDTFTITNERQLSLDAGLGFRNALTIPDERIFANMQDVQRRFSLPVTEDDSRHFNVEMETGTGKTYVYTKTIFELNKQYGFTKFIVVVPSVAIREGVYKSFQITADHFARDYDDTPVRCFIYNSKDLTRTARMNVEQSGVTHTETAVTAADTNIEAHRLPDFLRAVDNECFLCQRTVADVLVGSGRLQDFLNNPQRFTEVFIETIKGVHNWLND